MNANGRHLLADWCGCGPAADDADGACRAIRDAVEVMGATLLDLRVHRFSPQGFTAVAMLSESHLAVHSWPEVGYVAIDVFTCGEALHPEAGIDVLQQFFKPEETSLKRIERGGSSPLQGVVHGTSAGNGSGGTES